MRGINHAEDFGWSNAPRFGGGGASGNTTSTQTNEPWSGQKPFLIGSPGGQTNVLGEVGTPDGSATPGVLPEAARLYQTAVPQYYPGNTYQGMTPQQSAAYRSIYDIGSAGGTPALQSALTTNFNATNPSYTAQAQGTYNAVNPSIRALGSGALIAPTTAAASAGQNYLSNMIGGSGTAATAPAFGQAQNYLSGMIGGAGVAPALPAALQNQGLLSSEIGGAYLNPASDPGFQSVINTTLANTIPAITAPFTAAGRSDSGLASRALGQGVTDAIGGLTLQNYLTERQNQINAGQQAAQNLLAQQGIQQGASGQSIQSQLAEQGLQQGAAQQAAQNLSSMIGATQASQALAANTLLGQQAEQTKQVALSPAIDQTMMSNLNTAAQAAGMTQQDLQNQINAAIQQWNYQQMLPWNQLGLYNSMIQGNYGGTTTTTQPYYTNQAANVMGGVSAAASVAASIAAII